MPERVELWWQRRQRSKGRDVPYAVGEYREQWAQYPVLVRQYHPDLNHGVTLTQVPPAAEVYLVWQCDVGHQFVATPEEQRMRPGGVRRRSSWCPDCAAGAVPVRVKPAVSAEERAARLARARRPRPKLGPKPLAAGPAPVSAGWRAVSRMAPDVVHGPKPVAGPNPVAEHVVAAPSLAEPAAPPRIARPRTTEPQLGDAFLSYAAPQPASAAEARLRAMLAARLDVDVSLNAVRVRQPFFERLEVWPDIPIPELKVAIEYDTTGRDGLEHVGRREETDRHKDRLLRQVGWEVVRIRCGKLQLLGPYDIAAPGVSGALIARLIDRLGDIRGDLIVRSYLR